MSATHKIRNPLIELDRTIDWETFRPLLDLIHKKDLKSNAGAKPKDVVLKFKGLVIQNRYGLSDDQLEFQGEIWLCCLLFILQCNPEHNS